MKFTPPGEDSAPGRGGGNGAAKRGAPGEDGVKFPKAAVGEMDTSRIPGEDPFPDDEYDELENTAQDAATGDVPYDDDGDYDEEEDEQPTDEQFLQMTREADSQALQYIGQVNRKSWERGYRALHQEHFDGSKYRSDDYRNRSRLFIPKTRTAVRKDMAAVAASMFGSVDAVNCAAGNEGDPEQRASAAVVKELVNYRTDRKSHRTSIPWFHVAMGSRQTSLVTGICLSKQSWKLELKKTNVEDVTGADGVKRKRDVWKPYFDRPDVELIPPENFTIDPAADWRNPAQDAAYILIKWPMRYDEIRRKQKDPRRPWKKLDESVLRSCGEGAQMQAETIRRAREQGLDRFDRTQNIQEFDVIWVWEVYMRTAGQDWTFLCINGEHMLTDPEPVEDVYPEQAGERPLALGYGAFEAFRIFPMSSVESWQMLQQESNDIRNLALDSLKQNIMPVTKVVRGRNVDLDQLKRRGQGTSIMVTAKDDVTWEKVQSVGADVQAMTQKLDIEFDDLSGQQNYGTVQDNNNLGKTLGGLKLAAGAANAVQEFDIRIWIETWAEVVLAQVVRLEQYYESDPIVIGLCADRAKLLQKHGINEVTDQLLENNVTIQVNVGLGAGDPQQRLAKFQSATQVAMPFMQMDKDFQSGKKQINLEAIMEEVFGASGYRDGGKRFVMEGEPAGPNPAQDATVDKLKSEAERNRAQAKAGVLTAISAAAKVGLGLREIENEWVNSQLDQHIKHVDQIGRAQDMGHSHGVALQAAQNAAKGLNPDGTAIAPPGEGGGGEGGAGTGRGGAPSAGASAPDAAASAPKPAAGGGIVPPPDEAGAGSAPLNPADVGKHSLPSADAGQQQQADAADQQKNLDQALKKPKKRTVAITSRGPDGRASAFEVTDHH